MASAPPRGFVQAEYENRLQRAQAKMAAQNLAGLLLSTEPEVRYFSGFHTLFWQSPTRPWFLFVPQSGKPVAIIPEIGADLMGRTWIDDIRTWPAPHPEDDGISLLTELLSSLAARGEIVGVLKGHETHMRMPQGDYERLISNLPGLKITDCTALIRELRMVKSEAEIEKLRYICQIGSQTFDAAAEFVCEGKPLDEVFREFRRKALALGADDVPYLVGGADRGGYSDVISPPTARQLAKGDIIMLDTGAVWDGYFCDFDRNFAIGQPSADAQIAYKKLWHATEAGLAAARPGNTCRDLFQAMHDVIAPNGEGAGDVGRFGHGLGMQLTEWPSHAAFDETELKEGMVLTLEPSISFGGEKIMVHEEDIVVRADGAELLTSRAAPELPVL